MKIFVMNKKQFSYSLIVALLTVLICCTCISLTASVITASIRPQERKLPIYGVNTEEKKVALTLDCAWENSDTDILLELFEQYNVKATFFMTGDWCERYPEDVKRIFSAGHGCENHSYKHPHVENIERQKLIDDTLKCDEIIESLTGVRPTLYRAPYGEYSNSMLTAFENDLPHKVIQWDCDSRDWQGREATEMADSIMKRVKNGSIILFHNDTKNSPQAMELVIKKLISDGYEFVLVKDLIYFNDYTIDNNGFQKSYVQSNRKMLQ